MENKELEEQIKVQQKFQQLETIAKQYLTKEAISRYGNLKAAHPELALQIISLIIQAAQSGQLKEKIDDKQLKQFLIQLKEPKKEFKLTRK